MSKQLLTIELEVPEGYELVGYGCPKKGDIRLNDYGVARECQVDYSHRWPILRKAWVPQKFLPEGCWVFKGPCGGWHVCGVEPRESTYSDRYYCCEAISADSLARLHGETFNPPPVNKIQVRHRT